jgi:hypothetical protein
MKRFLVALMLSAIAVTVAIPETPVFAHPHYPSNAYGKRRKTKSTWYQHRRPRRYEQQNRPVLYIGGGLLADFISRGDTEASQIIRTGGGFDLFLGLRLSPQFALELGGLMSVHATDHDLVDYDTALLNGLTLDGKFFLIPQSTRLEPFLQFGLGGYSVQEEGYGGRELSGGGFHAGGGLDIHLSRALGFGVRALYKGIWMDNATDFSPATKSVYHNHATIEANVQLHF